MDCVLIGVSDRSALWCFGKIKESDYNKFVSDYAKFLSKHFDNVIVTPSDGVFTDIALEFGKLKGKKPVAYYPNKDNYYGIVHIEQNFPKYALRPINGDWYKLSADLSKQALSVICLGFSPGSLIEISFIKYHQKYGAFKNPKLKNIHLFIDERCIEQKLPGVFEEQINNIFYYSNLSSLGSILKDRKSFLE
ncbi:MAG: hypothetical protein NTY48_07190 [Candidatus Diapherotrites archaeon]|nr:hypothetical protein [Candidatus Diapherotrites archaeon]